MIQEIGQNRYHNEYKNAPPKPDSIALGYRGRELLMRERDGELSFLRFREAEELLNLLNPERPDARYSEGDSSETNFSGSDAPVKQSANVTSPDEGVLPSAIYLFSIDETEYFWIPELASLSLNLREPSPQGATVSDGDAAHGDGISKDGRHRKAETVSVSAGADLVWRSVDSLRADCPRETAFAGVTGYQLAPWYESRRFCPRCAHAMVHDERERMMCCPECGLQEYPKISPAVIVAVTNGEKLLLTRYAGRSYKKYALVAGFAEIGETIEETVAREVMEETGLRVKNLRYYKSQPWSFSGTLLMGFFAELDGPDAITLDEHELAEAFWCPREDVPEDDGVSLTREMMRAFREGKAN